MIIDTDQISDDGSILTGRRGRAFPRFCMSAAGFDLLGAAAMAFQGRIMSSLLMAAMAVLMARTGWGARRPVRIGPDGVNVPARVRRIPWDQVDGVELPGQREGSVVVIRAGRRLQTGFPARYMCRIRQIATDATARAL